MTARAGRLPARIAVPAVALLGVVLSAVAARLPLPRVVIEPMVDLAHALGAAGIERVEDAVLAMLLFAGLLVAGAIVAAGGALLAKGR